MSGEPDRLRARLARAVLCEAHDPTGEPGAGNRHAGFGEQGLENETMGAGLRARSESDGIATEPFSWRASP